jgi:hypothetical protein
MKKKKLTLLILVCAALLTLAASDYTYTGPRRTTTQQVWQGGPVLGEVCTYSSGWRYVVEKTYACGTPGSPWETEYPDYYYPCSASRSGNRVYENNCAQVTVTVNLPPATVSGSAICDQSGDNGWCTGGAALNLSAAEPLSGYVITGIESTLGMLCNTNGASVSCAWSPPEGESSLNFWALSSYGDTSSMQSASFKVDTVSPDLTLLAPPPDGRYGWFVSLPVVVSATASDSTSGLASLQGQLDGEAWQEGDLSILMDGIHDLTFRAEDHAGNWTTWEKRVAVDTLAPVLSVSIPAPDGANGWYVTPVEVYATASDVLSGVQEKEVSLDDGASWQVTATLLDGVHTVLARATDVAGNTAAASATVRVDTQPPVVTLSESGATGNAGWYISSVTLQVQAMDATSGLSSTEVRLDGGEWQSATTLMIPDGVHVVKVRVTDLAGNVSITSQAFKIDTNAPQSAFVSPAEATTTVVHGLFPMTGATLDAVSGVAAAQMSLDGGAAWFPLTTNGGGWSYAWDTTQVPNGTYRILVRADDVAGNQEYTASITLIVANQPPAVAITERWTIWETAAITIHANILPLAGARLTVRDDQSRWPDQVIDFSSTDLPAAFKWDGRFGDGTFAPPGEYRVTVEVWDIYGNTGRAAGTVFIPEPSAPPTDIPTLTPTATPAFTPTFVPTSTHLPSPATPSPAPAVTPPPAPAPTPEVTWPASFTGSLAFLFLSLSLLDPRPAAWRCLARKKNLKS